MGRNSSENQSEALLQVKMIIPTPKQLFSTESLRKLIIVLTFALMLFQGEGIFEGGLNFFFFLLVIFQLKYFY